MLLIRNLAFLTVRKRSKEESPVAFPLALLPFHSLEEYWLKN